MTANILTLPWDVSILILLCAGLGTVIAAWTWLRRHRRKHIAVRTGVAVTGILAAAWFGIVAYGSFIEPQLITVTRASVPFPVSDPLRIAVIADMHAGPYKGARYFRRVVRRINALMPDIVLIAGDFVLTEEVTADLLPELRPLAGLRPAQGTYAAMGNHDHGVYRTAPSQRRPDDHSDLLEAELTAAGITVLRNTPVTLSFGESTFAVAGVEDAMSGDADILRTLDGIPADVPVILVSHNPDVILDPASSRAALIVAGHTHGGQIRLPWFGPLATLPTHLGRKYDQGIFTLKNGSVLALTRGIGESGPRARLFAPPEIMLIETIPQ